MRRHEAKYLVREGIRGAFLHPFISFAAVTIIAACLVVMGSFTLGAHNIDRFIVGLGQVDEVVVIIEHGRSETEAREIHAAISRLDNVYRNDFFSSNDRLAFWEYVNPDAIAGLREDDDPFQHRCVVRVEDFRLQEQTIAAIAEIDGVDSVDSDGHIRERLGTLHNIANIISWALIILLSTVSVLIVSNTIKLATYERREEIAIMRVVGATRRFIRVPFFIEGALLGVTGGLLAYGVQRFAYVGLVGGITEMALLGFTPVPFAEVNIEVLIAFVVGGLLTGALGSVVTIRRFLRT